MSIFRHPPPTAPARPNASRRPKSRGPRPVGRLARLAWTALLAVAGCAGLAGTGGAAEPTALRFGSSSLAFADVNAADAHAAVKAWAHTVATERGIPVDPALVFLTGVESIRDAMLTRKIDGMAMPTMEYWAMRRTVAIRPLLILGVRNGRPTEEYLLLVRRDNPAASLADLRGRSLMIAGDAHVSLAATWIETVLLEARLGLLETFFGKSSRAIKLSRVVLPVFFRQADACIVTREGFRLMVELNPQLGQQLRILAESPPYLPSLFCFRGDLVSAFYDKIFVGLDGVTTTAAGRQTLALFQTENVVGRPASDADATLAMLDRHQRLVNESAPSGLAGAAAGALEKEGKP